MLSEYNEALHIATEKEISYKDGYKNGVEDEKKNTERERRRADEAAQRADEAAQHANQAAQRADETVQLAAKALIDMYREIGIDRTETCSRLCSGLNIDHSAAQQFINKYWTT